MIFLAWISSSFFFFFKIYIDVKFLTRDCQRTSTKQWWGLSKWQFCRQILQGIFYTNTKDNRVVEMSINMIRSQKKNTYFIPCRKEKFGGATLLHHWRFIFQWAFPAKAENKHFTKEDKNQPHFDACLREKKSKKVNLC